MPYRKINIYSKFTFKTLPAATVANAGIGSLKSLHILFDKYLGHMLVQFEQNRRDRTIQNFDVLSPIRVTRLKVAPNMADPMSIKDCSDSSLNVI